MIPDGKNLEDDDKRILASLQIEQVGSKRKSFQYRNIASRKVFSRTQKGAVEEESPQMVAARRRGRRKEGALPMQGFGTSGLDVLLSEWPRRRPRSLQVKSQLESLRRYTWTLTYDVRLIG